MKMYTMAFNSMRELTAYVNAQAIPQENIVSTFQSKDGGYILTYFAE